MLFFIAIIKQVSFFPRLSDVQLQTAPVIVSLLVKHKFESVMAVDTVGLVMVSFMHILHKRLLSGYISWNVHLKDRMNHIL